MDKQRSPYTQYSRVQLKWRDKMYGPGDDESNGFLNIDSAYKILKTLADKGFPANEVEIVTNQNLVGEVFPPIHNVIINMLADWNKVGSPMSPLEQEKLVDEINQDSTVKKIIKKNKNSYSLDIKIFSTNIMSSSKAQIVIFDKRTEGSVFSKRTEAVERHYIEYGQLLSLFESDELPKYLDDLIMEHVSGEPSELAEEFMNFLNKKNE